MAKREKCAGRVVVIFTGYQLGNSQINYVKYPGTKKPSASIEFQLAIGDGE
jgi:hypothetical protein